LSSLTYVFAWSVVLSLEERVVCPPLLPVVMAFQTPFDAATRPFPQPCHADVHDIELLLRRSSLPFLVQNVEPTGLRRDSRPNAAQRVTSPPLNNFEQRLFHDREAN